MSPRLPRIDVVGHVTHDRYGERLTPGGCAFYGARAYAGLGLRPGLWTLVGEDFACEDALRDLDARISRQGETTLFTNLYPPGRPRLQIIEAVAPTLAPPSDPAALAGADLVHLAPVMGEVELGPWRALVSELSPGPLLGLNVQGFIKAPGRLVSAEEAEGTTVADGARVVEQVPWQVCCEELRGVDVACVSDEDLIDQGDLFDRLLSGVRIVALTHGAEGAEIFADGRRLGQVGVYPTEVVDPTGAGDTFAAAFLAGLARGEEPLRAAALGAAAASIVIEAEGGAALDRLDEAAARRHRVEWLR